MFGVDIRRDFLRFGQIWEFSGLGWFSGFLVLVILSLFSYCSG